MRSSLAWCWGHCCQLGFPAICSCMELVQWLSPSWACMALSFFPAPRESSQPRLASERGLRYHLTWTSAAGLEWNTCPCGRRVHKRVKTRTPAPTPQYGALSCPRPMVCPSVWTIFYVSFPLSCSLCGDKTLSAFAHLYFSIQLQDFVKVTEEKES